MRRIAHSTPDPSRETIFYLALIVVVLIVIGKLFSLQVLDTTDYASQAIENRLTRISDPAPRGVIFDRNRVLLARNLPSFTVTITPAFLPDNDAKVDEIYRRLSDLLDMAIVEPGSRPQEPCRPGRGIKDLVDEFKNFTPFSPVKIKCDVDRTTAFIIKQEVYKMPGVDVIVEPRRDYPTGPLTSNIVGYMARIPDPNESAYFREIYNYYVGQGLRPERDRIGVQGIEASMQEELAGVNGSLLVEKDVEGRILHVAQVETDTIPGQNIQLTIDVRLQAAVEAALRERMDFIRRVTEGGRNQNLTSGVVIVMNPNSGEIYAMVSWPTYDNNRFANGIDFEYYSQLAGNPDLKIEPDPDYPLINHAVQILYPPGSTFKIVTATGVLEEKVIDPNRELDDPGKITIRNKYYPADPGRAKDFVCWNREGHGKVNFTRGVAESCNVYFYKIGGGFEEDKVEGLGIDLLYKWMRAFGFGKRTEIDLPAEQRGTIPTKDWKRINIGENWALGDTYNAVIGQGYVLVTPLQLLNAYNAVINGGTLYKPHVVDKFLDGEGNVISDTQPVVISQLPDPNGTLQENLSLLRTGLRRAVTEGTLSGPRQYGDVSPIINLPGINVAGKTGTAEYCDALAWSKNLCFYGRWPAHAWTVLYAPYEAPEVAVLAFVYNGSEGSIVAGPIANDALRAYFQIMKGATLEEPETPDSTEAPAP
jgi:penicillin-binding protein 2